MAYKYYAVKNGREIGVFTKWYGGAFESVNGYKGAEYKGFNFREDAELEIGINKEEPKSNKRKTTFFIAGAGTETAFLFISTQPILQIGSST